MITDEGVEMDPLDGVDVHPAATLFPLIDGTEFAALVDDIREHGQRESIVFTPDGQLLDGRNRLRACVAVGITPTSRVETTDPWAFVVSANVHRRHLSESQRAMIAARIAHQRPGGARGPMIENNASIEAVVPPMSQAQAAGLLNVSRSSVQRAREVLARGSADLQAAIEAGQVTVGLSERILDLPGDGQARALAALHSGLTAHQVAKALQLPPIRVNRNPPRSTPAAPSRHRYLGTGALRTVIDSLGGLDLVLTTTDGLDPSITPEEAARWLADLARARGAIGRVSKILTERRDSPS